MPNIYFERINGSVCKFAKKPEPSVFAKPEWFKESDYFNKNIEPPVPGMTHKMSATIKNCPAVSDAINFGYTLFTPMDIHIDATNKEEIYWYTPDIPSPTLGHDNPIEDFVNYHPLWQIEKYKIPEGYHKLPIKINTFFGVRTDEGYSVWITHPLHNHSSPMLALSAVVDTDVYPSRFPYAVFIREGFKGVIHAGTPLIQVIPFKREDWNSHIVDLDEKNLRQNNFVISSRFSNSYKKVFWKRKKFK